MSLTLSPLDTWKVVAQASPAHKAGPAHVFTGVRVAVLGSVLDAAVFTATYSIIQSKLLERIPHDKARTPVAIVSASIASICSTIIESPFTLLAYRLRLGLQKNVAAAYTAAVAAPAGWRGLYVGAGARLAKDLPFDALEFATYQALKRVYIFVRKENKLTSAELLALGMLTGATVGAVVAPLDLVATRIVADPVRYRGVVRCLRTVAAEEGLGAVFGGIKQKIGREAASSAIFFPIYDMLRERMNFE